MSQARPTKAENLSARKPLTIERIRDALYYSPKTGNFFWKNPNKSSNRKPGSPAGYWSDAYDGGPRLLITIDGEEHYGHRIAFAHFFGWWPEQLIDHKDGDPANNRIVNLREASHTENTRNARVWATANSGFKGVCRRGNYSRWRARIRVNGRLLNLGHFSSPEEAHEAYAAAALKYFGEFARAS